MASEIRVNKIINRSGLSTVTFTNDGAIVSGIVSATVYTGSGANLTDLPAGNLSGTLPAINASNLTNVPAANLTGNLPAISAANLTNVPAANITGTLPAIDGSNLTGVGASFGNSSVNTSGIITATAFVPTSQGTLANRNKLYNGDMRISQRGTSAFTNVGNSANTYTLDRWKLYVQNSSARFQIEKNTDHTLPDGFTGSMRISCTTTDTSLAATDEVYLQQSLEGQDVMDFAKGTPSAKQYTLSFYARSDKTGTYIVRLLGRDNTTSNCSAAYTVTNSWTRHVITFPADTASNRKDNNDNGEALRVMWYLVAGSGINNGTLQTTWANSSDTGAATGQVNFADNNSNRDFYITGCQLEAGPVATPFEYVPYPQQLSRCKRYFQKFTAYGDHHHFGVARAESNTARTGIVVPVPMRALPTVACNGSRTFRGDGGYNSESTSTPSMTYSGTGWDSNSNIYTIDFPGHSLNHNQMYCLMSKTTSTNALTLDSEF